MNPIQYVKEHTDATFVVSGIVTALAVAGVFLAFRKSGVGALRAVADATR